MPISDEVMQEYVDQLLRLQSERSETLTSGELEQVALELGLTAADLEAAAAEADKGWQRGLGFQQHGRLDDAIREFEKAAALAPTRLEIVFAAAAAYQERYRSHRRAADWQQAERLARRCLEQDPDHQDSFELLNELDRIGRQGEVVRVERAARWPAVLVVAFVLGLAGLASLLRPPKAAPGADTVPAAAPQSTTVAVPDQPALPITFEVPEALTKVSFEARRSHQDLYTSSGFYKLEGAFTNGSRLELSEVKGLLELLDKQGAVVASQVVSMLSSHQATVRPGDVWVYNTLCRADQPVAQARMKIQEYESKPAATAYATPKPVPVEWAFERPSDLQVTATERRSSQSQRYFRIEFGITNSGTRAIEMMQFQVRYYDARGKQMGTREFWLTISSHASLPVGETWVRSTIRDLPAPVARYELVVIQAS